MVFQSSVALVILTDTNKVSIFRMKFLDILTASNCLSCLMERVESREPRTEGAREASESVEESPVCEDAGCEAHIVAVDNKKGTKKAFTDIKAGDLNISDAKSYRKAEVGENELPSSAIDFIRPEDDMMRQYPSERWYSCSRLPR